MVRVLLHGQQERIVVYAENVDAVADRERERFEADRASSGRPMVVVS
jgi:hypothetical protein